MQISIPIMCGCRLYRWWLCLRTSACMVQTC